MSKKILFSPVGGTDPIKYCRDGSMLHICRYYKPDIIYLYMSHEMLEYHKKDNRYIYAIEQLGICLNHVFETHLIERDELVNVQQYDVFYRDFRDEIKKIEESMEDGDELFLNMASGTPAMKSALLVMATFAEYRFIPIQVSTPKKSMNAEHEDREDFDNELNWECNEDNLDGSENRCTEVKSLNLVRMMKTEIIKKHIMAYDYAAALTVADEMKESIPEDVYEKLQIMEARVKLDHKKISRLTKGKNYDIYPVKEGDKLKLFEYMLVLQMKIKRGEFADFIRGITPLVVDILENILKNKCNIRLDDCCIKDKGGINKWSEEKLGILGLKEVLEDAYKDRGGFKYGNVSSGHIANIIKNRSMDIKLIENMDAIIFVEERVRNIAAHEIVSVTDEWIRERTKRKNETGKSADEIFSILKYLLRESGVNVGKDDWQSYDGINESIVFQLR